MFFSLSEKVDKLKNILTSKLHKRQIKCYNELVSTNKINEEMEIVCQRKKENIEVEAYLSDD